MSTIIKTIVLSAFIFGGILFVILLFSGADNNVKDRLQTIKDVTSGEQEESRSFFERLVQPVYNRLFGFFSRFTPANVSEEYEDLLVGAGLQKKYTPIQLVTNQILLSSVVALYSVYVMRTFFGGINVPFLLFRIIVSGYLPLYYLRRKSKARNKRIQNALPNFLDMIYISVEAGLSFDAAMNITAKKTDNELAEEISRAMNEINKGRIREDALYSIAERTNVDDVRTFIATIIQSEKLGSNISNVLRIQSDVIREKRKQRAEEEINKMPIKMLIPLVFLLLPSLFVVIMGPAFITISQTPF